MPSRILTVNLETKYYPASIPKRNISCLGSSIDLTDAEYTEIISELPEFWHMEEDKLLRFVVFADKSYFCERQKKIFNYSTREQDNKIYKFDGATEVQSEALYAFFVEKFTKYQLSKIENFYDSIMSNIKDMSFVKFSLFNARNDLLLKSDYLLMPDYPISQEERDKWVTYRQELRDLTDQEAWKTNDILNIEMPVSPEPLNQISILKGSVSDLSSIPENLTDEIITTLLDKPVEEIIKNITKTTVKFELLKSLSKMKLPFLNMGYSEILIEENAYNTFIDNAREQLEDGPLPSDWWEAAVSNIDDKIEKVNEKLKSYNIGFTINDILNAIIEENKISKDDLEAEDIIEEL